MTENLSKFRILVVDDEEVIRSSISRMLSLSGFAVETAEDGHSALRMLVAERFDVMFLDVVMPAKGGIEVLREIHEKKEPRSVVIMMTGYPSVETAVKCMQYGAMDFMVKPFRMDEVESYVSKAVSLIRERGDSDSKPRESSRERGEVLDSIIGNSSAIRDMKQTVRRVARTDSTVLITGESGTGKELVARAIHKLSRRTDNEFVPVDCSALVESLIESELFGYVKGAFTGATDAKIGLFELANRGTFFFDEVGNLTPGIQAKLLRVLQEREYMKVGSHIRRELDIRIIVASNRDLLKAIERGAFREDLYYRINVVPIHLLPLRNRVEDIPQLLDHFIQRYNITFDRQVEGFSDEAMELMMSYPYPGNVREIKHIVERIMVLHGCDIIGPEHLPLIISRRQTVFDPYSNGLMSLETLEKKYIQFILDHTKGIRQQASDILGINRKTLATKIRRYEL